jgi:hypothetical protein
MPSCVPIRIGGTTITHFNEHDPQEYILKLEQMDEEKLYNACKDMIWFSAYAANRPSSDFHWMCDACYEECRRREKPNIYDRAHKAISDGV